MEGSRWWVTALAVTSVWSIPGAVTASENIGSIPSTGSVPRSRHVGRRDDCTAVNVVSGDSYTTPVEEYGVNSTEFNEYNTASDLCSTLAIGDYGCCSAGTLPDYSPQPDADGYYYTYTVQSWYLPMYVTHLDDAVCGPQAGGWHRRCGPQCGPGHAEPVHPERLLRHLGPVW